MVYILLSVAIGYVFGCFLTAYFIAKRFTGKDIADIGSGNPGMANIMSNVGKIPGVIVLVGDITKTFLAMGITNLLFTEQIGSYAMVFAGLGVLLGHNFPIWRRFKGGKGVAVTCAWIIALMPFGGVVSAVSGGIITILTGLLPLGAVAITVFAIPFGFIEYDRITGLVMVISALIMIYRNYSGFINGFKNLEERKFNRKRNKLNTICSIIVGIITMLLIIVDYFLF